LSERAVRRWTREGLIPLAAGSDSLDPRYDLRALAQFRRFRELRARDLA